VSGKGNNIVVTGGAGFIGSWLCERLVRDGYRVICIDNLSSGRTENLEHLDVEFIKEDVRQPLELKVDYVFHLASRASPVDFQEHSTDILLTNSLGTYNMLQLSQQNRARFLLASTSEVYGEPLQHPQNEEYWGNVNPIGPRSCYDESKRFAEALAMSAMRDGLDVRIARIFNTYGGRMRSDDGRAIPNFINQATKNEPITVYGDGTQTRSFCYVSDMVDGLARLMFGDNLTGEVVNLGNPNETTILQLATLIKQLTDSKSEIVFRPLPQNDPSRRKPDITRAKKRLNWQPKIGLEEGLRKTIEYYRQTT
jgi:nucleoside-diphosphate-sugar epimerase